MLREFARRLRKNVRGIDLACRFGGEEFVVVMPDTEARDRRKGRRADPRRDRPDAVCHRRSGQTIAGDRQRRRFVAAGAARTRVAELMKRADIALYEAKSGGRNRVVAKAA